MIVTDSSSVQYKDKAEKKNTRDKCLDNCCNILGVDNVYQWSFPDMRLDTLSHVDINIKIEEFLTQGRYDTIFVHHRNDINMDHRVLFDSVMVAARPTPSQSVKSIYCYYTPSSSEWGAFDNNSIFSPNLFIDIEKNLSKKTLISDLVLGGFFYKALWSLVVEISISWCRSYFNKTFFFYFRSE